MGRKMAGIKRKRTSTHSIRCTEELWTAARRRANKEGVTMNHVMTEILEGYATGRVDLPTVTKVYAQTK